MNKQKNWIEVTIPIESEYLETVQNYLFELGCTGTEEKENTVTGYFTDKFSIDEIRSRLESFLKSLRVLGVNAGNALIQKIPEQDWGSQWRKNFKPIKVTPRIIVKPPWETLRPIVDQIIINITPRMAFGTGSHETTRLCLIFIEKHLKQDESVLDVGTGSGILAIAAAKLGAARVLAVDNDKDAFESARENIVKNHVQHQVELHYGSLETIDRQTFDLIFANINRTVLSEIIPKLKHHVHSESRLILSGILDTEKVLMKDIFSRAGFDLLKERSMGEWIAVVVRSV